MSIYDESLPCKIKTTENIQMVIIILSWMLEHMERIILRRQLSFSTQLEKATK
jgi:hypothetical protein